MRVNKHRSTTKHRTATKPRSTTKVTIATAVVVGSVSVPPLFAQPVENEGLAELEEVIVTGSYLRTDQSTSASPLEVHDRSVLETAGAATVSDVIRFLPINTGSEFNVDIFSQSDNAGTAQFNLRGLGLGSTLVLLNGRRQVNAGGANSQGVEFVDVNSLLPTIMIDRLEILKGGASSIYGTEAVAGVVNFFTRDDFEGLETQIQYQQSQENQDDIFAEAIWGWRGGDTNIVAAASYFERTNLLAGDLDGARFDVDSGLGQPGAFGPRNAEGVNVGAPAPDPRCTELGGTVGGPLCRLDLAPFTDIVPEEDRFVGMLTLRTELAQLGQFSLDLSYSDRSTARTAAPSFPGLNQPTVPSDNPGFVDGSAPNAILGFPNARFLGRPLGTGSPTQVQTFDEDIFRIAGALNGEFDNGMGYMIAATYADGEFLKSSPDILLDRFIAALNGVGGPDNNQYFNPFGSAIGASPTSPFYNDPAVIDDFSSALVQRVDNELFVFDAVLNGEFAGFGNRSLGWAVGAQYRSTERTQDIDQAGNDERYWFFVGGPDSSGDTDVTAVFAEFAIPLADSFEVQAAVRFEDYGGAIGDTVDPRIAGLWTPADWFSLRASYSSSFRAPQLNQLFGADTSLVSVTDTPGTGLSFFAPTLQSGTRDLTPEETDTFNVGVSLSLADELTFNIDYWRFETTDLIVAENAQQIVDDNDPAKVIREAGGNIERLILNFINAAALDTDGVDLSMEWSTASASLGELTLLTAATYLNSYELRQDADAPTQDLAGFRNRETVLTSAPEWRGNATLMWSYGPHSVIATARYIDSYLNNSVATNDEIDSWTTFDLQYSADLPGLFGRGLDTVLTIGVNNLTDEEPPIAATVNSFDFDTKVHDPRGRMVYLRLKQSFF